MKHKTKKYFRNNKVIDRTLKEHPKKSVDDIQAYQDFINSVYNKGGY